MSAQGPGFWNSAIAVHFAVQTDVTLLLQTN